MINYRDNSFAAKTNAYQEREGTITNHMSAYSLPRIRRNQNYLGQEFTLVNVQISSADTASLDLDLFDGITNRVRKLKFQFVQRQWLQIALRATFNNLSGGAHTKTSLSRRVGTGISTISKTSGFEYLQAKKKWC